MKSTPSPTETAEQRLLRERRDVVIKTALEAELNGDNEDENLAIEEVGFTTLINTSNRPVVLFSLNKP